jgi:hypothetical protein
MKVRSQEKIVTINAKNVQLDDVIRTVSLSAQENWITKKFLPIAAGALLSGCALSGPGGSQHQAKAQEAAPKVAAQVAQTTASVSSGSDLDFRPGQLQSQNDRIEAENARIESDFQDNSDEIPLDRHDLYRGNVERDLPIYRQDQYRWSEDD